MNIISNLPHINACFNSLCVILLLTGFYFIKQGNKEAHKRSMLLALLCSVIFLTGYLTYHSYHGTTRFTEEGIIRIVYFSILISHTILAMVIVPLVGLLLWYAYKQKFDSHKRLARWTFPIWLYVSSTGVLVYFFLYHWFVPLPS